MECTGTRLGITVGASKVKDSMEPPAREDGYLAEWKDAMDASCLFFVVLRTLMGLGLDGLILK
jgi:hypothetical protein